MANNLSKNALIGGSVPFNVSGTNSTGLYAQNITSIDDFLGNQRYEPHVKTYQVFEIEDDLLALSAAWYRIRQAQLNGADYIPISKLLDSTLKSKLLGEDIEQAAKIRDYYSKKIMVQKLKGIPQSRFKEDLNSLIHSSGKIFKEDICPLAYRLPEFYVYDTDLDELFVDHNREVKSVTEPVKNVTLVKSMYVGKKYTKRKEYWFSDDDKNLHRLTFAHDNPLLPLLDFTAKKPMRISGAWRKFSKDDREFFINDKPKFG